MLDELVIIHSKRAADKQPLRLPLGLQWNTCLRQIAILNRAELGLTRNLITSGQEVYRAHEAYEFLLQIVCGLHSPIVGETEVMGQFREFSLRTEFPTTAWGHFLRQFTNDLLTDAKRIRHQHFRSSGSQSYGSLARRSLKQLSSVTFLGAGQLTKDMLPWLLEHHDVTVANRNLPNAAALRETYPQIKITDLQSETADAGEAALIVAAPLSAEQVAQWVARQSIRFVKILDLRGESATDPLTLTGEVIDLQAFFELLNEERQRAKELAQTAELEIARLAERHLRQMQCRPFGWEDLCA